MANGTPMAAEKVRIDGDGKVGIGETAPGYPLDIKNSAATGTAEIRLNQNNATKLWTGLAMARQGAEKWFVGMDNATDNLYFRQTNAAINGMTINTSGNVGIGTSTFDATGTSVLNIISSAAPAAYVDNQVQIYSTNTTDNTATIGLMLEQAVEAVGLEGPPAATAKIKIIINGTAYYLLLSGTEGGI